MKCGSLGKAGVWGKRVTRRKRSRGRCGKVDNHKPYGGRRTVLRAGRQMHLYSVGRKTGCPDKCRAILGSRASLNRGVTHRETERYRQVRALN